MMTRPPRKAGAADVQLAAALAAVAAAAVLAVVLASLPMVDLLPCVKQWAHGGAACMN